MIKKNIFDILNQTENEIDENLFQNIFNETINFLKIKDLLELSLVIVKPKFQKELNIKYRNKYYIADVLTFALEEKKINLLFKLTGYRNLGDIFICYEIAKKQAKDYNHSLKRELSFLFLHGFLHILGYNHIKIEDEKVMFKLQKQILKKLKIFR